MRIPRVLIPMLASVIPLAAAPTATAASCITVGVYQDNPARGLPALRKSTGPGVSAISTYLTAGQPLDGQLITTANRNHARLVVTWQPDSGTDGANQPKYRLTTVTKGRYDASLKTLAVQLAKVRKGVVLRPMPEMNTPWYAWSGTVNGNTPARYLAAWRHVRGVLRRARNGKRIALLWAPYAQSIPPTGANQIGDYFPGVSQVDLVGASAYNFGATASLSWSDPGTLFTGAYSTIEAMAAKPFWIAETGSTATGGDKAGWIRSLASLRATSMPRLAGVLWYDVSEPDGDFAIHGGAVTSAFRTLLREGCR
jgi:Glycosyl hydrolase family 26